MNWGITADIHLKLYDDKEYTETGLPLKLDEILRTFRSMCLYLRNNKISKMAVLGDVNHTKQQAAVDAFSEFRKILEEFEDITFYIIPGNHDMTSKGKYKDGLPRTAVDLLSGPSNIVPIRRPTVIDNMSFVPYFSIDSINDLTPTDILMTHLGLTDATLSNGISIRNRFRSSDFKKWKLIVSGHYHGPQHIDNFYYVGSLMPLTRAEFDEDKRFLILDSETLELESVYTEGYRKYYEIIIEDVGEFDIKLNEAEKLKKEGNFVVVRNRSESVIREQLEGINIIDEVEKDFQSRGLSSKMDDAEQMSKYLEIEKIPKEERKEYLDIGLNLIQASKD